MITIFNRRSVYFGFDMKAYADRKDRLDAAGIPYKTSVKNRGSARGRGRGRETSPGVGRDYNNMYQYEIWVHSKDYDMVRYKGIQ